MSVPDGLHGAYRYATLRARLGPYELTARLHDGTLQPLWPGVLAEADRWLDLRTRVAGALMINGDQAVVAGPTAARLFGADAIACEIVHVMRPYGPGIRRRSGMAIHRGAIPPEDVVRIDGLPVLVLDRVVSDILCTQSPRDALALTDQAFGLRPAELIGDFRARVAARLANRADQRGTRKGSVLLELATGRAESPPESWLRLMIVELGFPVPEANWPLTGPDGTTLYRLDLSWPSLRIAVEYNGYAAHFGREAADQRRLEDLRSRGWIVITVDKGDLSDSARLIRELNEAFARRGAMVRCPGARRCSSA